MRAYLVSERILYDEKIIWTVSYKRAYLISERAYIKKLQVAPVESEFQNVKKICENPLNQKDLVQNSCHNEEYLSELQENEFTLVNQL